jgi:hypothetical protein
VRERLLSLALVAAVVAVIIGATTRGGDDWQTRYERAHRHALRYRAQRDDLQRRLTRRVLEARGLRRALLHRASSVEALHLAAIAYHVAYTLLYRIASCESTGGYGLKADAKNRYSTAAGLGQFLDGSWASTPYARFSPYSPYASALAMANEVHLEHTGWQWAASRGCWA